MCDSCDWQGSIDTAEAAMLVAQDIIDGYYPDAGRDFADSVSNKLSDIAETIRERSHVTTGQAEAIENMSDGLSRWY